MTKKPKNPKVEIGDKEEKEIAAILNHKVNDILEIASKMTITEIQKLIELENSPENKKLFGILGGPRKTLISDLEALIELKKET